MRLSPVLAGLAPYPFAALRETRERLEAAGVDVLDLGMGEPREETPEFIRAAVAGAVRPMAPYPVTGGLPELRSSIARWAERRYGVALDPETEIIPTLGTKEVIFAMASVVGGDLVAVPSPGYPVPDRGARFAGKGVLELPLLASNGFLPDFDAVPAATWERVGLLWLNYPNNPTAAVAGLDLFERAAELARRHDFLVCSDEAYSEIYFGAEPPRSVLEVADRSNVLALNTLSKRSAMPGYRSGFAAGDPVAIAALKRFRPNTGTVPLELVQRVSAVAWDDEAHVDAMRAIYRAKREVLLPACEAAGLHHVGGDATMFLWLADPDGRCAELRERGVLLAPGEFFGPEGVGYARLALVPPLAVCEAAAARMAT
jgi:acetylornithine aminotransferase